MIKDESHLAQAVKALSSHSDYGHTTEAAAQGVLTILQMEPALRGTTVQDRLQAIDQIAVHLPAYNPIRVEARVEEAKILKSSLGSTLSPIEKLHRSTTIAVELSEVQSTYVAAANRFAIEGIKQGLNAGDHGGPNAPEGRIPGAKSTLARMSSGNMFGKALELSHYVADVGAEAVSILGTNGASPASRLVSGMQLWTVAEHLPKPVVNELRQSVALLQQQVSLHQLQQLAVPRSGA